MIVLTGKPNAYDEELLTAPANTHETCYQQETLVKATKFNYRQRAKVTSIILLARHYTPLSASLSIAIPHLTTIIGLHR